MSKTTYNISLKGYVGGYDFDRSTVDRELAKNEGKQVNVLIDSLGGSLATGLSISVPPRHLPFALILMQALRLSSVPLADHLRYAPHRHHRTSPSFTPSP